jgi:excinuclease ABC subunit C
MSFDALAFARTLKHVPGVYRMLGTNSEVLYIGKAKSLRKRVESYFARPQMHPRLHLMVSLVEQIEVIVTRTEAEALLLECQLIKSLKPRFNIDLRDDKSYPFIWLTKQDDYPRLAFYRGNRQQPGKFFGPFPSAWAVKETLETLQKLFQIRNCEDSIFAHRSRPCLQHQIKRCTAPCVGLVSTPDYALQVKHAEQFLSGHSAAVIDELGQAMDAAAHALNFETAAKLRDQISALRRVTAHHFVAGERGDLDAVAVQLQQGMACVLVLFFRNGLNLGSRSFFPKLPTEASEEDVLSSFLMQFYTEHPTPDELLISHALEDQAAIEIALSDSAGHKVKLVSAPRAERAKLLDMAKRTALSALSSELAKKSTMQKRAEALAELLGLQSVPERIECFDISHTMGEATVASCVVFNQQGPIKSDYRKFNISGIEPGDDYAAMRQALTRRYQKIAAGAEKIPDLLLIDGGKGQLTQALDVLDELAIQGLCVVGVAKGPARKSGFETLFVGRQMREIWPGPDALGGHFIQQVRDEAHRFAITGHRQQRAKTRQTSVLEEIDGIGPTRRRALLKAFGGLRGVATAGVEELQSVAGVEKSLAERIYAAFRGRS